MSLNLYYQKHYSDDDTMPPQTTIDAAVDNDRDVVRQQLLDNAGATVGDTISIHRPSDGNDQRTLQGVLMASHSFSRPDVITVKMHNGYNIGITVDENTEIRVVSKAKKATLAKRHIPVPTELPDVSIIGTGGTIASYVDYRTGAVHPVQSSDELTFSVPELATICNVESSIMFGILSENITVAHWQQLAKTIVDRFEKGAHGVIITHGTDTMGYTASALSFMLRDLPGPVVLVGSQRSSDRPSSDATLNLIGAAHVAAYSDIGEVVVVMHGSMSDDHCAIHRGNRVRKMHTSRRDAFRSVNIPAIGQVRNDRIILDNHYKKASNAGVNISTRMDDNVSLVYAYPGLSEEHFYHVSEKCHGIVIAGTGLGHAPDGLIRPIREAIAHDTTVVMTSQCIFGRVNQNVYSSGRDLLQAGVIGMEDMLPETAYVKLMWALGQAHDPQEVHSLMKTSIAGEFGQRSLFDNF